MEKDSRAVGPVLAEKTTTQLSLPVFFHKNFVERAVCWKCRPEATAALLRVVEKSTEHGDVETFQVFRCERVPAHVFQKRVKA
jgi:hypothetical protein